jgi:hypothetical protein
MDIVRNIRSIYSGVRLLSLGNRGRREIRIERNEDKRFVVEWGVIESEYSVVIHDARQVGGADVELLVSDLGGDGSSSWEAFSIWVPEVSE